MCLIKKRLFIIWMDHLMKHVGMQEVLTYLFPSRNNSLEDDSVFVNIANQISIKK